MRTSIVWAGPRRWLLPLLSLFPFIFPADKHFARPRTMAAANYQPLIYEVLIHELMPDPEPGVGLPPYEYIELRNAGAQPVQLQGWRLAVNGSETVLPAYVLQPGGLLLLCSRTAAKAFGDSIPLLGLTRFPPLPNDSGLVALYDAGGRVMHALSYARSWYNNPVKENGGWSLEMVDATAPCAGPANWKAAVAAAGGTPGAANSVQGVAHDTTAPALLRISVADSITLLLYFSKTLDSAQAATPAHYRLQNGAQPLQATVLPPLFSTVQLRLAAPLQAGSAYSLSLAGIQDCKGIAGSGSAAFALPLPPDTGDVVIAEILYDPRPPATEFIELYNRSNKAIPLRQLLVALRGNDGQPGRIMPVSHDDRLLLPGDWLALTADPPMLCAAYNCVAPGKILQLNLPPLPNEGGRLLLLNAAGQVLDEAPYSPRWQMALAGEAKGVSLERLDMAASATDPKNWHSAAATAGGATPGAANSQQLPLQELPGEVNVQPAVFSPDNDGIDDLALITYRLPAPGFVANITIFSAAGRPVRQLLRNSLPGMNGSIAWDGLGEARQVLPAGIYVIFTEVFNVQGSVKRWKLPVVLARKAL